MPHTDEITDLRITVIQHEGGRGSDYCIMRRLNGAVQYWDGSGFNPKLVVTWPHTKEGYEQAKTQWNKIL